MAELLPIVLSPIVERAYDPLTRHISYAFKCKRNVNTLKEGVEALKGEQERLQQLVVDEKKNGKRIFRNVDEWLEKAVIVEKEGNELVLASERAEMKCFFGFCPNLKTRYQVSRKAEKKARELAKLLEERQRLNPISYADPLPCMEALPTEDYLALEPRIKLSEDIIKVLTTDGVSMVGVHGIGGVGKTTLAKEILRQVKEQKLFDEMVMATITKDVNVKGIQAKIGEALGLKFDGVETEEGRASQLFGRLELDKEKKKKVLIILDDLWEKFDLVKVGISSKNQLSGCKIFLTSRDLNVLSNEMDCQKNFEVGCLQEKEAWDLFQKMANNSFEEPDLQDTAIEVAKVCAGLPLAIVTIARTLKDKSLPVWNDVLLKLKNTGPSKGLTATIYSALELSYEHLEIELQSIFLLCSQMGYNATTGDLLKYGIGLGLFSNVSTLEQAQNRVCASVGRLKELRLLLEGGTNKELAMHDFVREVGRWIAARDDNVLVVSDENKKREWSDADKLETYTRIWIFGSVDEVPEEMHCPKLVLAHVDGKNGSLTVPYNLFKGLHKLKVLSFTSFTFLSLPSSLCLLENLKTLCFHQSMELKGVSIIGKLTKLEVLSFAESNITHLPVEIGQLTKLRLLDLSGCRELEMIPRNILSRLHQLEELYMGNSFDRWTVEGQESQDTASLGELKQLVSLTNLEISIPDARLVSEDIFPKNLCRYKIFIGDIEDWNKKCKALTNLKLKLNANLQIEKGLMRLVKKSEDLYLDGLAGVKNFVYDLDNDDFPKLKHLHLRDSPEVQYFADMTKVAPSVAFPVLESLYLENLISLEKIYQSIVTSKLRKINVENCDRLTHLFLFSVAQGLSQLQEIKINSCASLETGVAEASEVDSNSCDATDVIEFSQLKYLVLCSLPKLTSFCSDANPNGFSRRATNLLETNVNEDVKISMPLLNHKILLPNLKEMYLSFIDNMETLWHGQLPPIKNSFQNLTDLTILGCQSLKYVFSYSLIKYLGQLQSLSLIDCETLEEVILVEEESGEEQLRSSKAVLLPKLQSIEIRELPELKRFCKGYRVECPLLNKLSIWECPQLKTFVSQECEQVRLDVEKNDQTAKLRKPLFDEMILLPNLKEMHLSWIDNMETLWHGQLLAIKNLFQNLTDLSVIGCHRMKYVFSYSLIKCLGQLQSLKVRYCSTLEEVILVEEESGEEQLRSIKSVLLPKLQSIEIRELPELKRFCKGYRVECPLLNKLSIWDCPQLKTFVSQECEQVRLDVEKNDQTAKRRKPLFDEMILLPNLKNICLWNIDNMETLWHGQLPAIKNSFQNLTELKVDNCHSLKYVFSYSLIKCLGQLQTLRLVNCRTLEEVILVEEESGEEQLRSSKAVLFPKLQSIDIFGLPELERFCKGYRVECPLLNKLSIWECPQLKTFVSQECEQVRLDVEKNDQTAKLRKPLFDEMVVFPSLADLKLCELISIEKIWHNQLAPDSFCKLKNLEIYRCEKLADIFPPILILLERFQKLEELEIWSCDCVEEIFGVEGSNNAEHISFQLKRLYLRRLAKLRHIWTEDSSRLLTFPNLCKVKIKHCSILRHVFPRPMAENLPELEELTVRTLRGDEIVATGENGEEAEVHPWMWPKLKKLDIQDPLSLLNFPKISSNLEELDLNGKDTSPSQILNDHVHFSKLKVVKLHHFMDEWAAGGIPFGFLQKLPNLEKLKVMFCDSLVTLAPSSTSFKNLTTLSVSDCSRLLSLVTASMAKSLGQLINFQIGDCKMMMEIIDREGDEADNIIFTKLQCLQLVRLESLTSFCSGDHTFSFPSLKEMSVENCPKMRVFCAGHITTPKLHKVNLGQYLRTYKRCEGNLNSTIQELYIEENQAVLMSNQAESSKQPNLNAEDAQQQNM